MCDLLNAVQFVCNSTNVCSYRTIDGASASSLTVYCGEWACQETTIICPHAPDANCTIHCGYYGCWEATFESAANSDLDTFSLMCALDRSCYSAKVNLQLNSIASIDIACSNVCHLRLV